MRLTWHRHRCWWWRWRRGHWSGGRSWSWRSRWHWGRCRWQWRIISWPTTLTSHAFHSFPTAKASAALHFALVIESIALSTSSMCSSWEIGRALGIRHRTLGCTDHTLVADSVGRFTFDIASAICTWLTIMTSWNRSWSRRCRSRRRWRHRCWHGRRHRSGCRRWWGWWSWRTTDSWV